MQEIAIKDLLKILRARLIYLLAIPVAVTMIAGIYFLTQANVYSAETKLYVLLGYKDSSEQTRFDVSVGAQFASDFKELIKAPYVMDQVAKEMGEGVNLVKDVKFDINAASGTRVLNVTATSKYPTLSMAAANTISKVFVEYIKELTDTNVIKVASEAVLPKDRSGPARMRNTMIVYALSLFGLAGAFIVLELMNTKLRTAEEIEEVLGLPVLANVEDYRDSLKDYFEGKGGKKAALSYSLPVMSWESVKILAKNIQFSFTGKPMRKLMVTSAIPTEGKSSLSILVSEALAYDGYKVLIVDLDVRKPSIGKYLGTRHKYDLIDYVTGGAKFEDIIAHKGNIDFVDSRHKLVSPSQIVNYDTFDKFLEVAESKYDVVIFDTPPLGLFIDAAVIATKVNGVLLVVGKGLTERDHAKEVVAQLYKANANLIGAALNYADRHKSSSYYGKSYARYASKKEA